jgi:protein TonB
MAKLIGVLAAVALHLGFLLFGGVFFLDSDEDQGTLAQVELLGAEDVAKEQPKPEDEPREPSEELAAETEQPPDAAEIIQSLESQPMDAPALEAASLSAIELALSGQAGGAGDFADALTLASGGRIGGTGKAGALDSAFDRAFSLAEIDQRPRAIVQTAPLYPAQMRGKKVEGVVTLIFVVDANGRVSAPRVETSSHPAFEKPAVEAVKQWRFEPAVKGGKRVGCKMRIPIRFAPS